RLQGVGIEVAAFDRMRPRQLCYGEIARFVVVLQDEVAEWLTPIERRVGDAVAPREVRSCLRALSVPDGGLVSEMLQDPIRHGARVDESRIREQIRNAAETGSDAVRARVYRVAGDAPIGIAANDGATFLMVSVLAPTAFHEERRARGVVENERPTVDAEIILRRVAEARDT